MQSEAMLNECHSLLQEANDIGNIGPLNEFLATWGQPEHAYIYPNRCSYLGLVQRIVHTVNIFDMWNDVYFIDQETGDVVQWTANDKLSDINIRFVGAGDKEAYGKFVREVISLTCLSSDTFKNLVPFPEGVKY